MKNSTVISVKNISKTFRIPHNKVSSVRGAFVRGLSSPFSKKGISFSPFEKGGQGGFDGDFEEFKALDNVSFEVKKGEFFGIIGRNGSGKSTLLKILAGIYQVNQGTVEIDGMISPFLELGIGFNPELSGRDNVHLNATVLGMTKKQIDEKFDSIVQFSELERFIDQKLKNYSSGMQVRLAFSVSIHANRDILLMDEVLAVGDSNFQSKCLEEFKRYKGLKKTVILVTHDTSVVRQHCDRALLLRNGKVDIIGEVNNVCDYYLVENVGDKNREIIETDKKEKEIEIENEPGAENEKKEKKNSLKSFGNKHILIKKVEIFDERNKNKNAFFCGEKMQVRIKYFVNKTTIRPHFGLSINDVKGTPLVVTNHLRNSQYFEKVQKGAEGEVVFVLNKIPFVQGDFSINVMLYTDKIGKIPEPIHQINNAVKFSVFNKNPLSDEGLVFADCQWSLN